MDIVVSRFGEVASLGEGQNGSSATLAQSEPLRVSSALPFSLWPASTNSSTAPSRTYSPSLLPPSFTPEPEPAVIREIIASDGCIFLRTGHLSPTAVINGFPTCIYGTKIGLFPLSTRSKGWKGLKLGCPSPTPSPNPSEKHGPSGVSGRDIIDSSTRIENGSTAAHALGKSRPQNLIPPRGNQ